MAELSHLYQSLDSRIRISRPKHTPVAQLAEQRSPKPQVGGSSPSWRASSDDESAQWRQQVKSAGRMNAKVEQSESNSGADIVKLSLAVLLDRRRAGRFLLFRRPVEHGAARRRACSVRWSLAGSDRRHHAYRTQSARRSLPSRSSSCARWSGRRARKPCARRASIIVVVIIISLHPRPDRPDSEMGRDGLAPDARALR